MKTSNKILFDIWHLPQYNFFRNTLNQLCPSEYDICTVNRGKLLSIIKAELPQASIYSFSDYKNNNGFFSLIIKVILPRIYNLFLLIRKNRYSFIISASYQSNIIAKILGIPSIAFNDDPEKINFSIVRKFANEVFIPPYDKEIDNVKVMNALKEWSYLSPKYFSPDESALKEFNIKPNKYIFIREVSTKSLNYRNQKTAQILNLSDKLSKKYSYVLSLEEKELENSYPDNWVILKEPVKDIHSLMFYSCAVISSGDSMAREGALLGVPSFYCGIREMKANKILINKNLLKKVSDDELIDEINNLSCLSSSEKNIKRDKLLNEWIDINDLIFEKIRQYKIVI